MAINKEKMNEIFGSLNKEAPVAILTHDFPDPDAMGAAAGFAVLLKEIYGLNSRTFHLGTISHPQNKSLKNILHITLEDGKNFKPENVSAVVVLDTDATGTGMKDKTDQVDVRIDHHNMARDNDPKLLDVRPVGATCSLIWEYLTEFNIDLSKYPEISSALVLGIRTDTADFTTENTADLDIKAFSSLLPFADKAMMERINKFPLPKFSFEVEAKAFKDKEIKNTTLASFVGDISSHRYIVAAIADRFMRIECVDTVMVLGLFNNDIIASVRSDDSRVDVDDLVSKIFGRQYGGGKEGSGGASFPLGSGFEMLKDKETRDAAIKEVVENFKEKLFDILGEKGEEESEDKK